MSYTAEQKLQHAILLKAIAFKDIDLDPSTITAENVSELFEVHGEDYRLQDATNEVRSSGQTSGIKDRHYSRHYECEEVAAKMPDGSWVGWTYWHGGGKHGEPESIPWIDMAYDLTVTEEEKVVVDRTFAVKES